MALYARGILDHLEELIQKDEEEKRKEKKAAGVFVPAALPIEYVHLACRRGIFVNRSRAQAALDNNIIGLS